MRQIDRRVFGPSYHFSSKMMLNKHWHCPELGNILADDAMNYTIVRFMTSRVNATVRVYIIQQAVREA